MPATSEKQRRYMGMELAKQRRTGGNDTGMSEGQLRDFARKPTRGKAKRGAKRRGRSRY